MSEFTKNYFISPKAGRVIFPPKSPSNNKTEGNKRAICLLLGNLLKAKIAKELSFGLGKIIIHSLPKVSFKK